MKCPKCKRQLRKNAKFCPGCGAKIQKRTGRRVISVILIIALLVGIVAAGWAMGTLIARYSAGGKSLFDFFGSKSDVKISSAEEAIEHAKELGEELGYENALSELTVKNTTTIDGDSYYRLQQNYQGIPVYGRAIVYSTDESNILTSVSGNLLDINESIDANPTLSQEKVEAKIKEYFETELGFSETDVLEIDLISNDSLCIYIGEPNNEAKLAYCLNAGMYEVIIDAHSAEILFTNLVIRTASTNGDLQGQLQTYRNVLFSQEDNEYFLKDTTREITSYLAINEHVSQYWGLKQGNVWISSTPVTWSNNENPDSSAVDAYVNVQKVYNYFASELNNFSVDGNNQVEIQVITGLEYEADSSQEGKYKNRIDNAFSSISTENTAVLAFGIASAFEYSRAACLDWVAHEYTHSVERLHSGMVYDSESGAIMEGLSDIFGELVESWDSKQEPNWLFSGTQRNMKKPSSGGYPTKVTDRNWSGEDYVHGYSTVISHSAYLMWNGISGSDETKKLSTKDLAQLWYRAMLMMPSDCNFAECRVLVELAASSMNLTESQLKCISEAFDAVGIVNTESVVVDYELASNCKLSVIGKDEELYDNYTITVSGYGITGSYAEGQPLYVFNMADYNDISRVTSSEPFVLPSGEGVYSVTIVDNEDESSRTTFTARIRPQYSKDTLSIYTDFEKPLVVKITDESAGDAYEAYLVAANKTTESGGWSEHLNMTANMAIMDGNAKTKTKVTLTSDADVSNHSENDPSQIRMSGSAEMTVMGQTYAWDMEYENGTAHYQYTKPSQTSADMKIDPSFFNFGTMTSDMMSNAKISGSKITFTVPGEKIAEVGIAAVNQMSGVDDLEYGDVDVTVAISDDGKIDNIVMVFHASLEYQGYDADVDYNIDYRFSDSSNTSSKPLSGRVPIVPGIYAQDGSAYNTLTIHEIGNQTLEFTAFWYRIGDLSNVEATLENNIASFEFFTPNAKMHVFGTLRSSTENSVILKISESTHEYVGAGEYSYSLVGRKFTNTELKAISDALNVPSDLDTQITQGEPAYWEGGGIYRTPIEVYYNGKLIAGASVNSLTGEIAGNIYVFSAPDTSGDSINIASTFGFNKAWDIHDRSGTEHFVTSLAFSDDGTFCCAVGWYLSEWYTTFTGTYQVNGNEIILNYTLDGDAKMSSYQVKWEDRILRQTSEENLVIAHQIGSEYPFEENPWYTAEQLKDQVSTFMRYNG